MRSPENVLLRSFILTLKRHTLCVVPSLFALIACGDGDGEPSAGGTGGFGGITGTGAVPATGGGTSGAGGAPAAGGALPGSGGVVGGGGALGTGGTMPSNGGAAPGGAPGAGGAGGSATGGAPGTGGTAGTPYADPGAGPWAEVPAADVATVCKLDPAALAAARLPGPWAIFRYGKLCAESGAKTFRATEAWSTTKTLGSLVAGIVAYQTKSIPRTGAKTGGFSDEDMASHWLTTVSYNREARVAHVLGMVAHNTSLAWGQKSFRYDTVGSTQINSLSTMLNAAIAQDTGRLGANLEAFTKKFLYEPLGMKNSTWSGGSATKNFAYSWSTDLMDMGRVGLLINNWGIWAGQRLLDEQWVYRMTHPSWEDANTGFGYLTWLNSSSNWTSISGGKQQQAGTPGTCAPVAVHKTYPHGVSDAKDCNYSPPHTCAQKYDVGVWNAEGLGGQLIQGHRGLDMVIVARNAQAGGTGPGTARDVWNALRPAVIKGDPVYKGDETAFCKDYGSNNYAPDSH